MSAPSRDPIHSIPLDALSAVLKSQYRAALAMLRQAVERCPADPWTDGTSTNPFWHIAYHAVFFTHLYLQPDEKAFRPWAKHREEYQFLGPLPWPPHKMPNIGEPYTQAEVLEYLDACEAMVPSVDQLDLMAPECGFWWYKISKLEHQIVNIRHLQHHAAQLADRLRNAADIGVDWVGAGGSR